MINKMNREVCVLIYSQYSQASKKLMENIKSLSYDLVAITGMSLLQADSQSVRDRLTDMNIDDVPSIFVKYFNGKTQLHVGDEVYDFIDAVSKAINRRVDDKTIDNDNDDIADEIETKPREKEEITLISKKDVMTVAAAMQKSREIDEKRNSNPIHTNIERKNRTRLIE